MAAENYEWKKINQDARFDVYKVAKPTIYRAIKEFVRVWGVNVEVYQPEKLGIGGHTDSSRTVFNTKEPIYEGAAFVPSTVQGHSGRGGLAVLDIFDRKTPRIFFDKKVELPNGALVIVRDMKRVFNYIIDEKITSISPNNEDVYQIYTLTPFNVIDNKLNEQELEAAEKRRHYDISEFEVDEDYDTVKNDKIDRGQKFTDTETHKFGNIKILKNNKRLNND